MNTAPGSTDRNRSTQGDHPGNPIAGVEGILGGLGALLGNITRLAEAGERLSGDHGFTGPDGRKGRLQFGLSIKTLGDSGELEIEPFGNVRTDKATGEAVVHEVREPIADVFDEGTGFLVIAEMPGIENGDINVSVEGDVLTISAERGEKRYHKELLLDAPADHGSVRATTNNGIVEIRLNKAG